MQGTFVPSGKSRGDANDLLIWGIIPLSIKVTTADSGGAVLIMEHRRMPNGGPPRHVHPGQDEWFYVLEGEFDFEIGDEKFSLSANDSILAPRGIPHAWACVGQQPGSILIALSPALTFETFIRDAASLKALPSPGDVAKAFAAHGMTVVGPPLGH